MVDEIINPQHACARVTVVVLSVCLSVLSVLSVCLSGSDFGDTDNKLLI